MSTPPPPHHRQQRIPPAAADAICPYLDLADRFTFATLHRMWSVQAETYLAVYYNAFDQASNRADAADADADPSLLDVLLRYCLARGIDVSRRYSVHAIAGASAKGAIRVLRWWRDHVPAAVEAHVGRGLMSATFGGRVEVLEWWKGESGVPLRCHWFVVTAARYHGGNAAVRWWRENEGSVEGVKNLDSFSILQ
ncbi:hypothetical protein DFJ73DRAFT_839616 [Zopfochytrium polystomum]|nr:hypothetical protein DFJ73DRAFT_839616 [Zopfochytrium polystomum]